MCLSLFVELERHLDTHAEGRHFVLLNLHVHADHFRNANVAQRLARAIHRVLGRLLPGLLRRPHQFNDLVDAVTHVHSPSLVVRLPSGRIHANSTAYTHRTPVFSVWTGPRRHNTPNRTHSKNFYHPDTGQLTSVATPEGAIDFEYESCGSKLNSLTQYDQISHLDEHIEFGYDGTLVTSIGLSGTVNQTFYLGFRDGDFALETFTYAGATESYTYDDDGLLLTVATPTLGRTWTIDRDDPATSLPNNTGFPESIGDGTVLIDPTYNQFGQTKELDYDIGGQSQFYWLTRYDDIRRIKTKRETIEGGTTRNYSYEYDDAGRLVKVVDTDSASTLEQYTYDAQGRRATAGGGQLSYTYDNEDRLTGWSDTSRVATYAYDLDGFLTSKEVDTYGGTIVENETTTYTYGARGELIAVELPDATLIEYVNGPTGQRLAKKVDGEITEKYLWGGLTNLLAVLDANSGVVQRFEYAGGSLPIAMTDGSGTYYLHYDQVGSLRAMSDDEGTIQREIVYDSFGNTLSDSNPSLDIHIGFAGGLMDSDTGLNRFGFRDYDPEIGRWTAKDPIGFAGGDTDLYAYCAADPVNCVDPAGLALIDTSTEWYRGLWETGQSLRGILKGGLHEVSFGLYKPCYDNQFQAAGGQFGEWLAFGTELAAGGYGIYKGLARGAFKGGLRASLRREAGDIIVDDDTFRAIENMASSPAKGDALAQSVGGYGNLLSYGPNRRTFHRLTLGIFKRNIDHSPTPEALVGLGALSIGDALWPTSGGQECK